MQTYNIHEAKTQLSRLVAVAAGGSPFIIAKAGKPLVKVVPLNEAEIDPPKSRIGFLKPYFDAGKFSVPDDFDTMCADEILDMFGIEP